MSLGLGDCCGHTGIWFGDGLVCEPGSICGGVRIRVITGVGVKGHGECWWGLLKMAWLVG